MRRTGQSVVELFRMFETALDEFLVVPLPLRLDFLHPLLGGMDEGLQLYARKIMAQLGEWVMGFIDELCRDYGTLNLS